MDDAAREFGGIKRDVGMEQSLEAAIEQSSARIERLLQAETSSPSTRLIRQEDLERLAIALVGDGRNIAPGERYALTDWDVPLFYGYYAAGWVATIVASLIAAARSLRGLSRLAFPGDTCKTGADASG